MKSVEKNHIKNYLQRVFFPDNDLCEKILQKLDTAKSIEMWLGNSCRPVDVLKDLNKSVGERVNFDGLFQHLMRKWPEAKLIRTYLISDNRSLHEQDLFSKADKYLYASTTLREEADLIGFLTKNIEYLHVIGVFDGTPKDDLSKEIMGGIVSAFDGEGFIIVEF